MSDEVPGPPTRYSGTYENAYSYDEVRDMALFRDCVASTPGAALGGEDWSLPPGLGVLFDGDEEQRAALERRLRALPGVVVQGPWSA